MPPVTDVIVVGAGPSGSTAARVLALAGARVRLLERAGFPRNKPCGGAISMRALTRFPHLRAVTSRIDTHLVSRLHLESPAGEVLKLQSSTPAALMIRRLEFDRALALDAQEAGAELIEHCEVTDAARNGGTIVLTTRRGQRFEAPLVIAADGANSVVARRMQMGAGWAPHAVALDMMEETPFDALRCADPDELWVCYGYGSAHGYAYVFPKRRHVNVGIGYLLDYFRSAVASAPYDLQRSFVESLCADGVLEGRSRREQFTPALIPVGGPRRRTVADGVMLIGDAGGFVNGFTAEGIYYGMVSGDLAARAAAAGTPDAYEHAWRREMGAELRDAVLVQRFLFRRPARIDAMVRGARRHPGIAQRIVEYAIGRCTYRAARRRLLLRFPSLALRLALAASIVVSCLGCAVAGAQQPPSNLVQSLLAAPAVRAAMDGARATEPQTIADQIRLCEVEAPPFGEAARGELFAGMLRAAGAEHVRVDAAGNVIGERPGRQPRPNVVLSAHLDTVFPKGTDVQVRRDGDLLRGPGIGDDCRGLAEVLAVARLLAGSAVVTPGTITFVGTVGEEGLGDLRGVKRLFGDTLKDQVDRFLSIDGSGLGVTNTAVGSARYRVTFKGPGGHSFGSFGTVNPIHAVGRAIARLADLEVPLVPRTTFNVGRIGGGTAVNAIPDSAWMEVDLRSSDPQALKAIERRFREAVDQALAEENARWRSRQLTVSIEVVGVRPAGAAAEDSPIMRTAAAVQRALGLPLTLAEGSTDANLPLSLGIPALTIDAGGSSAGVHTLEETFNAAGAWKGTARALLLTIALARP